MINYTEKGYWLHQELGSAGLGISQLDNVWTYDQSKESEIQSFIDSFDPLPFARTDAVKSIKDMSAIKRLEYVTDAPGKDAEYKTKQAEAELFEDDATVGLYMQARMDATSETAQQVADIWNAKSLLWRTVGADISAIEDKAVIDLDAETDWTQCSSIASAAVTALEAV